MSWLIHLKIFLLGLQVACIRMVDVGDDVEERDAQLCLLTLYMIKFKSSF
jgi:hypothetical protein